jgi:hypothetical protein
MDTKIIIDLNLNNNFLYYIIMKAHPNYTVHEYPLYTVQMFNGLNIIEEKHFNTLDEIVEYVGEHKPIVHKAIYKNQLQRSTNIPFKVVRNINRYKLTIENEEPEYFLTIKNISDLTGEYYGLIKGRIIKINN